jgi:hypothetical protein
MQQIALIQYVKSASRDLGAAGVAPARQFLPRRRRAAAGIAGEARHGGARQRRL